MGRIILVLYAAVFGLFGVFALVVPARVQFSGMLLPESDAALEGRVIYGALSVGLGLFSLYLARVPELVRPGLIGMALVMGAIAGVRAVGVLLTDASSGYTLAALSGEILIFALAILGLWSTRSQPATA